MVTLREQPSVERARATAPVGLRGADVVVCEPYASAATDASGYFRISGLGVGRYVLRFCYRGAQLGERAVDVTPDRAAVAFLELAPDAFERAVADATPCCAVERSHRLRTATTRP